MTEITQILHQIEDGDPSAAADLLPLVYQELRKLAAARLANEKPGQTLQATALVHDAYIRLVDAKQPQRWAGRRHFFAAAAESMKRILVEKARQKGRLKRGGDLKRQPLEDVAILDSGSKVDLLDLDEALTKLAEGAWAWFIWLNKNSRSNVASPLKLSNQEWIRGRSSRGSKPNDRPWR